MFVSEGSERFKTAALSFRLNHGSPPRAAASQPPLGVVIPTFRAGPGGVRRPPRKARADARRGGADGLLRRAVVRQQPPVLCPHASAAARAAARTAAAAAQLAVGRLLINGRLGWTSSH